jgi:hypothetical protein
MLEPISAGQAEEEDIGAATSENEDDDKCDDNIKEQIKITKEDNSKEERGMRWRQ